ncbi:hypothetical protein E2562_038980 [Oryza meyeriana var. granulata]|uniref:Integrase catalytic domain-containing protein n=1 Tax=Oryza meyeriana var. granulata TaxID=110450 RepID=A0A6G1FH88_9ORYZ|nr:hypothetical protein E2562_038980 [Oryza meyeriana var. granulata]
MDFIEGLPKVHGKSVVLTVVDRFSKYAHFIALSHPYTAASVARAFFDGIVRLHGFPSSIVSDRDPVFTSNLWRDLFKCAVVAVVGLFLLGASKRPPAALAAVTTVLLALVPSAAPAQGSLQETRTCQMDTASLAVLSCQDEEWPPSASCCDALRYAIDEQPSNVADRGLCCICVYIVTERPTIVDLPYVYGACGGDAEAVAAWTALHPPPVFDCTGRGLGSSRLTDQRKRRLSTAKAAAIPDTQEIDRDGGGAVMNRGSGSSCPVDQGRPRLSTGRVGEAAHGSRGALGGSE